MPGAVITRFYDPLLEKVTCWAPTPEEAIARMHRALREFRIRGVQTNLAFLENIITHPDFVNNRYTTRFIDTTPELFDIQAAARTGRRSCLTYIADVTVNGHPGSARPAAAAGRCDRADRAALRAADAHRGLAAGARPARARRASPRG